jgi:TolB-like protein
MKMSTFLQYGFLLSLLSGCSIFSFETLLTNNDGQDSDATVAPADANLHYYTEKLGKQLLLSSQLINFNQTIAVGTFLPLTDINIQNKPLSHINPAGHQLQESLVTFVSNSGLKVVEFKTMANIKLQNNLDIMLSREASELKQQLNVSYYLTGTYVQQDDLLIVNARLIELSDNTVIAAATQQIPANFLWHQHPGKVLMKHNGLYRQSY